MTAWNGQPRIVVGVDGSEAALTAVRYAASEARRTGADLEIVHATPDIVRPGETVAGGRRLTPGDCRAIGLKILNRARRVAREVAGDTWQITTALLDGVPAHMLASEVADARFVVLGDARHSSAGGADAGVVSAAVIEGAEVPVVVVPAAWADAPPKGVVAVGVRDVPAGERLLRKALAIAAARGATLRVVHAWQLPAPYDALVSSRMAPEVWSARVRSQLDHVLEGLVPEFPRVVVETELRHGQPAWVLREASRQADLLLLAREGRSDAPDQMGGTGRAVVREARCPVEILPLTPSARASGPRLALDPVLVG